LIYEKSGAVVTQTMNRPEIRNALSDADAIDDFVDACEQITRALSVHAAVVTGAGSAFPWGGKVNKERDMTASCRTTSYCPRRMNWPSASPLTLAIRSA
jgi:enoyl-CoA hydratase/carnithine racemase